MNTQEIAATLAMFSAAYPGAPVTEQTSLVWAENLIGVEPADGLAAARSLIRSSKFFPSIAEFVEQARAEKRARLPVTRALSSPPADREAVKRMMGETRRALAELRKNQPKHWHGDGNDKCPACAQRMAARDGEAF